MELFKNTQFHTFLLPEPKALPDLSKMFDVFRQSDLMEFWSTVRNHLKYPIRIQGPNGILSNEGLIPPEKNANVHKSDLMRFCALVHCCPENVRLVVGLLPGHVGEVLKTILREGCISYSELERRGVHDMLCKCGPYSWERWYEGPMASLLVHRESTKEGQENDEYRYERDAYLYIPASLVHVYAQALEPEMTDLTLVHKEVPEQDLTTFSAETQFIASFPLVQGVYRQSGVKLSGMRISSALAAGIQSRMSIPEILPSGLRKLMKIGIGQYFLPPLVLSLEDDFGQPVQDHVKTAVGFLKDAYAAYLYPALLPHIKGFRSNVLQGEVRQEWMAVLGGAFKSFPGQWISLEALCNFIHSRSFEPWAVGYTIRPDLFTKMYPINTVTGQDILPNNQGKEIDLELLRSLSVALYGMGAAELAVDGKEDIPDTPAGNIRMVRLTALGKYAFEFEKEYHADTPESQSFFSLDEKRLIIQSVSGNNPYESLLTDTAVPIGGGKFVMSAESFLKNCSTIQDVDEKVKFFEDYVANDPPQVWKDFFQTIRQHCKPLLPIKGSFILLQLDPKNRPLVDLILGDPDIRPLVNMVEGYRLLIPKADYEKLCKLLKKHGYLL